MGLMLEGLLMNRMLLVIYFIPACEKCTAKRYRHVDCGDDWVMDGWKTDSSYSLNTKDLGHERACNHDNSNDKSTHDKKSSTKNNTVMLMI